MIEDLNDWITTAAGWIAVIQFVIGFVKKLLPKSTKQKSSKKKRKHKRKK